tara:strand:- start:84 stop:320 length:237 start_codon:yes stop_codon:yes gene_type:complete
MKGNKQIFSKNRPDRIKGYKKLFREQKDKYSPSKLIAKDLVEAMEAQGHEVTVKEALAYLMSSYAVHDRKYYMDHMAS